MTARYPSFVRQLRAARVCARIARRALGSRAGRRSRSTILPARRSSGTGSSGARRRGAASAYVLLGTLPHSGRTRGVIAPATDQAHLVEAMDAVLRRLGGTARRWRVDRMATVIVPGSADVQASFAPVAKHYGASIAPCPPRRGNRKGSVEAAVRFATRAVVADPGRGVTPRRPRSAWTGSGRRPETPGCAARPASKNRPPMGSRSRWPTVGELADAEPLHGVAGRAVPGHGRGRPQSVDHQASVAFRGNRYSVAPGLGGMAMTLRHRLGTTTVEVVSPAGVLLVTHRLAAPGSGAMVRTPAHRAGAREGRARPVHDCPAV